MLTRPPGNETIRLSVMSSAISAAGEFVSELIGTTTAS
jgi:hypothetical protein